MIDYIEKAKNLMSEKRKRTDELATELLKFNTTIGPVRLHVEQEELIDDSNGCGLWWTVTYAIHGGQTILMARYKDEAYEYKILPALKRSCPPGKEERGEIIGRNGKVVSRRKVFNTAKGTLDEVLSALVAAIVNIDPP